MKHSFFVQVELAQVRWAKPPKDSGKPNSKAGAVLTLSIAAPRSDASAG